MKTIYVYHDENGRYAREISPVTVFIGVYDPDLDYDYNWPFVKFKPINILYGRVDSSLSQRSFLSDEPLVDLVNFSSVEQDESLDDLIESLEQGNLEIFKEISSKLFCLNYDDYDFGNNILYENYCFDLSDFFVGSFDDDIVE